ncbi:2-hydroxyacid dehydrogenase [Enterococcus sp. 669A]|uniref:2-hydroxyacid dehydrogenase n=1 Tax=Candidatus Enterococcus moelleringii TaxID=2815325 RepID=A0ABS3L9D4_9ENTE|nr:2-hydroxyacid dehydrogenase [Enterococcus sp. 669A]
MGKIVVVGDAYVSVATLSEAVKEMQLPEPLEIQGFEWESTCSMTEFQEKVRIIEEGGPEAVTLPVGILEAMPEADYLFVHIAPVSQAMLQAAPNLKLIGTCRGGVEHLAMEEIRQRELPVLHVIRNAEPVADFTIGLMYAVTRNIALAHAAAMRGEWLKVFPNDAYKTTLSQQTVALIGLGHVGKLVAKRLNSLGVPVMAYDPFTDEKALKKAGIDVKLVDLETAFSQAKIVSLHLRVTPETTNLIDQRYLKLMQPNAYLINTARPAVLEKQAFMEVLRNHQIAGAAIDVVWQEPIAPDDPLLELDNLTITSHIAGDTVDAIPRSPFLLKDVVNSYLEQGESDMLIK